MEIPPDLVALMSNYVANVAADVTRAGATRLARVLGRDAPELEQTRRSLNTGLQAALVEHGVPTGLAEQVARYVLWEADLIHFARLAEAERASEEYEGALRDEVVAHLRIEAGISGADLDLAADLLSELVARGGSGLRSHAYGAPSRTGPETSSQLLLSQRAARKRMFEELGIPSLSQLSEYTRRYLTSAANDLSHVRLQQLGDRGVEVLLKDVFVPPNFAPLDAKPVSLDTDDLLVSNGRLVILGPAGSGKSTAVRSAAASVARKNDLRGVPFILEMRRFLAQTTMRPDLFVSYIEERVTTSLQEAPPAGWLTYLLMSGRAVVFFDGFDEVLDSGRRSEIRDAVRNFAALFPACSIVVTSRCTGYDLAPFGETEFAHARICELTDPQVALYAENWFELRGVIKEGSGLSPQHFLEESERYADDIRRNPLMLSLLCSVYYSRGDIPRSLSELYEQCAGMLYEQWNTMRGIADHGAWSKKLRPALYEVANLVLNSEEYLSEGIPEVALIATLRRFFIKRLNLDPIDAGRAARDLAEIWAGRAWVLTAVSSDEVNRPRYGFVHQSFLEYFAAVYIFRKATSAADLLRRLRGRLIYMNGWSVALLAVSTFENWRSPGGTKFVDALVADASRSVASERLALLRFAAALQEVVPLTGKTQRRVAQAVLELYASAVVVPVDVVDLWGAHDESRARHLAYRQRVAEEVSDPNDIEFDVEDLEPEDRKYDGQLSTLDAETVVLAVASWCTTDQRVVTVLANALAKLAKRVGVDAAAAAGSFLVAVLSKQGIAAAPLQSRIGDLVLGHPAHAHWFGLACAFAVRAVDAEAAFRLLPWRMLVLTETLVQSYVVDLNSSPLITGELTGLLTTKANARQLIDLNEKLIIDCGSSVGLKPLGSLARDALSVLPPLEPIDQGEPHEFTDLSVAGSIALVVLIREVWGEEWLRPLSDVEFDFVAEELIVAATRGSSVPERARRSFDRRCVRVLDQLMDPRSTYAAPPERANSPIAG